MNEPGINSFEEFLLFYFAVTLVVGALWVVLEADVQLGPTDTEVQRRRRQRPVLHVLTALGVLHPACAVVAFDASRPEEDMSAVDAVDARRMRRRARTAMVVGTGLFALLCAPHLPILAELPAIGTLNEALPWEGP
jgi:hypothetical protein